MHLCISFSGVLKLRVYVACCLQQNANTHTFVFRFPRMLALTPKHPIELSFFCPDTFTRSDFFSCHPGPFPFTRLEEDTKLDNECSNDLAGSWAQCSASPHGLGICMVLLTIRQPWSTNINATGWNSKGVPFAAIPSGISSRIQPWETQ